MKFHKLGVAACIIECADEAKTKIKHTKIDFFMKK